MTCSPFCPRDMMLFRCTSRAGRLISARSDRLIRRSNIDDFLIGMVVEGNFSISQEGRVASLSPGELVLIDSGGKYEVDISTSLDLFVLKIARKSIQTRIMEHERYLGLSLKTDQSLGFVVKSMLNACIATAPNISSNEARRFEAGLIDMMGSAYWHQVGGEADANGKQAYKVFNRLRQFVEDHLTDPDLGPAMVSRELALSERYIRKIFAAQGPTSAIWQPGTE